MRKLLVTLALAGTLSVPSVVFAEASWYGSLRGGLHVGGGGDGQLFDGGSRWGIKGSAEVSDGLTAVYRFEHKISTGDGSQPGGRLAYAGLSGGFGTITVGQIWNAAYNHVGAITDKSFYFGDAGTGYRHGNAISYAFSSGAVGFQMDIISDGGKDSGKAIDKTEFGVTIGLGEIGKVAIAHTNERNYSTTDKGLIEGELPTVIPGTPPSLTPGTPASLMPGTPASLTPGTPASLMPGTPASLMPGTPASLMPGTPASLDPGTLPTLTPGAQPTLNPGAFPATEYRSVDVGSTAASNSFGLEVDDEGKLMIVDATRWIVVGGTDPYETADVMDIMHKTKVNAATDGDGALDADSALVTHVDVTAMRVVLQTPDGQVPTDLGQLASAWEKTVDEETGQITYRLGTCTEATCTTSIAAFVVEYRGGATTIDQETGNLVAPHRVTFAAPDSVEVLHSAKVNVPDGTDDGTPPSLNPGTDPMLDAGTLPSLNPGTEPTLNPGTEPTLNPGTEPTLDPGTEPTLDAGTEPTLDPGTEPTLDPGTPTTVTGGSVSTWGDVTTGNTGQKSTHVAIEFGLGGITPYVGYSESKKNGAANESKTMHYGFSGTLGETGMSFLVAGRNVKAAGGGKSSPWLFNVSKDLGGGATVIFEHGNADDGKSGKSRVGLHVSF